MRDTIRHVLQTLMDAGYEAYVVGGYVRDALMGRDTGDVDITTNATPDEVESLFDRVATVGKVHGTITVILPSEMIEVTTYRLDGAYDNHRHPEQVSFTTSLADDLARRDFTINAMAMAIDGTITDLHGGQRDLKNKLLRAIGDPNNRLQEDALRILRAVRFQSVLGFHIEASLHEAMKTHAGLVNHLSKERILTELRKMLQGDYVASAIATYQQLELPGLPSSFVVDSELSLVEQFAIAKIQEGFDSNDLPWSKQEASLMKHLLSMNQEVPSDVTLYDMVDGPSMIRVGSYLYRWPLDDCMQRYNELPIHQRTDVAVNGYDVMDLGYRGPEIDQVLRDVEVAVVTRQLQNDHATIIRWIKEKT